MIFSGGPWRGNRASRISQLPGKNGAPATRTTVKITISRLIKTHTLIRGYYLILLIHKLGKTFQILSDTYAGSVAPAAIVTPFEPFFYNRRPRTDACASFRLTRHLAPVYRKCSVGISPEEGWNAAQSALLPRTIWYSSGGGIFVSPVRARNYDGAGVNKIIFSGKQQNKNHIFCCFWKKKLVLF